MTGTTFFIIFIPILSIILLSVNLILAPHNPYQEKDNVFECGFRSFLGQNRTQFSVSFFTYGILFLLFDLEIIFFYPFSVSNYFNGIFGLSVVLLFSVVVTIGFVFEVCKNALKIESRQTLLNPSEDVATPHAFSSLLLQNGHYIKIINKKFLVCRDYLWLNLTNASQFNAFLSVHLKKTKQFF